MSTPVVLPVFPFKRVQKPSLILHTAHTTHHTPHTTHHTPHTTHHTLLIHNSHCPLQTRAFDILVRPDGTVYRGAHAKADACRDMQEWVFCRHDLHMEILFVYKDAITNVIKGHLTCN